LCVVIIEPDVQVLGMMGDFITGENGLGVLKNALD